MTNKEINIRLVELKNKSRLGTYVYIKAEGERGRYYKYNQFTKIDKLKEYYKNRFLKKQEKKQAKEKADKYVEKIKKQPDINKLIKKGISTSTIINGLKATRKEIDNAKKELLHELVIDKGILETLTKEENLKKIKKRLEYRLTFKDKNGDTIGTAGTFNKTPEQVIRELKKITKTEELIATKGRYGTEIGEKLENAQYTKYNHLKDGNLKTVKIQIIFRKAQ